MLRSTRGIPYHFDFRAGVAATTISTNNAAEPAEGLGLGLPRGYTSSTVVEGGKQSLCEVGGVGDRA
jgi:hypothetical protein